MILGRFKFYYPHRNITQVKTLITHETFEIGKSICDNDERKAYFKKYDEWFTDKSPLHDAINTGVLNCNGQWKCEVREV